MLAFGAFAANSSWNVIFVFSERRGHGRLGRLLGIQPWLATSI